MRKLLVAVMMLGSVMAMGQEQALTPDGCVPAKLVKSVLPVYPTELKGSGVGGAVVVQGTITKEGRLRDASAVSGPEQLRQAAVEAVNQWVFQPSTKDGTPVEMVTKLTVSFEVLQ